MSDVIKRMQVEKVTQMDERSTLKDVIDDMDKRHSIAVAIMEKDTCVGLFAVDDLIMYLEIIWRSTVGERGEFFKVCQSLPEDTVNVVFGRCRSSAKLFQKHKSDKINEIIPVFAAGMQKVAIVHYGHVQYVISQLMIIRSLRGLDSLDGVWTIPASAVAVRWDCAPKVRVDEPLIVAIGMFNKLNGSPLSVVGEVHDEKELLKFSKRTLKRSLSTSLMELLKHDSPDINTLPLIGQLCTYDFLHFFEYLDEIMKNYGCENICDFDPFGGTTIYAYLKFVRRLKGMPLDFRSELPKTATLQEAVEEFCQPGKHQVYLKGENGIEHVLTLTSIFHSVYLAKTKEQQHASPSVRKFGQLLHSGSQYGSKAVQDR